MCADRSRVLPLTLSIDAVAVLLLGIYTCFGYFRWKPRDCRIYCSKYTLITTHMQHEPNEDQQKKTQRLAWCCARVCVCVNPEVYIPLRGNRITLPARIVRGDGGRGILAVLKIYGISPIG